MKHLKIYEDYGFDRPTIHEDDDLFDDIMEQIGINIEGNIFGKMVQLILIFI
jgi:hypothetical protein